MAIKIFDGANFTGRNDTLETGNYPVLPTLGIDRLTSVIVEPGTYAEFFITQGFRDTSFLLFEGEYPSLGSVNNNVDAVKVFDHDPDIFPIIEFYVGPNFTEIQQNLAATGQVTNFDAPFLREDVFSSVKVPEGVTLTIFRDRNQAGPSLTLESGEYHDLRIFGFNNVASSIQIVQNNLEVTNIEYISEVSSDGDPILIESTAQNGSSLQQQANLSLETAYEERFTRSVSNSTLFGLEISRTATVGVQAGPLSASLSQTVTVAFENTFTFGREETTSRTITVSKGLLVNIPPENIAKAVMTLTPRRSTIEAIYTLKLKGTDRTTTQNVTIEIESASVGTVVIEKFIPVEA